MAILKINGNLKFIYLRAPKEENAGPIVLAK